MSQFDDTGFKTFEASGAIPKHARVKLEAAGTIAVAGLAEKDIGTALQEAFAAGDRVGVKLTSAPGTHKMIAAEALARGARVYTEAGGKVQDTAQATSFQWGTSLEEATADNDIIEVLPNMHGDTAAP
jgi:predicted RecA/RadA family phage recombinase